MFRNEIKKTQPPKIVGKFHVAENSEYLIRMDNYPTLCSLFTNFRNF